MAENNNNSKVDYERICILYENSKYGYIGMAAAALFVGYIITQLSEFRYAFWWAAAVFITYLPRFIVSRRFIHKLADREITPENVKPWEQYFFLASLLPLATYASAVFIPFGDNLFNAVMYYAVVTMMLMAGGILTYSTSLPTLYYAMSITLVPLIGKSLFIQDPLFITLGLTLAFGFLLLLKLTPRLHELLMENITLKLENQYQSLTDPLTKLGNRRRLRLRVEDLIPMSRRREEPFSIMLLDIDHFKKFNDSNGHAAGDELLIELANILLECCRDQDLVVRYGGEEFLLVLPDTNIDDAIVLIERIQLATRKRTEVTVSAGLAMHTGSQDFNQLIQRADQALYRAKEGGRNRYILAN